MIIEEIDSNNNNGGKSNKENEPNIIEINSSTESSVKSENYITEDPPEKNKENSSNINISANGEILNSIRPGSIANTNNDSNTQYKKAGKKIQIIETDSSQVSENHKTTKNEKDSKETSNDKDIPKVETNKPIGTVKKVSENIDIVQKEIPADVLSIKDEGNILFRNGAYADACEKYTTAIHELMQGTYYFLNIPFTLSRLSAM